MSVLQRKSVGDIQYHLINDIYPVHSASTGTISLSTYGGLFSCDGGYVWSTYNRRNIGGSIYAFDHSDNTTPTLDTWFNLNAVGAATPWTATDNTSGLTLNNPTTTTQFALTDDNMGRFLTMANHTLVATNTRWNQFRIAPIKNNTVSFRYNYGHFGTSASNDQVSISCPVIYEGDARNGDYFFLSYYIDSRESAQARMSRKHNTLSVNLLEQPTTFKETGISYDFTTNGWTTVNDTTNKWIMGSGTTFSGGSTSMYISNNNSTNTYTNTTANVSHFYKQITFPKNLASDVNIHFFWRCSGEVGADYGRVFLTPSNVTPVAGTELSTTYRIGLSEYSNFGSTYTGSSITISRASCIDNTLNLVFSWTNNSSGGSNPPMAVDSIRLTFYTDNNVYERVTGDTESFGLGFGTNGWTVVNGTNNIWTYGTGVFSGQSTDRQSAYIVNTTTGLKINGDIMPNYSNTTTAYSHFYKDFTFTSASTLDFDWISWAENAAGATQYDYGAVVITTTATTPTSTAEVSTTQATAGGDGRIGATTNLGKFNEGYGGSDADWRHETIDLSSWSGQTKRLVFTWKDDNTQGDNPPFCVDNVKITGVGNWAVRLNKIN